MDNDSINNNVTEKWTNGIKRLIPKLNLLLPFAIWLGVFLYDWHTNEIGQIVNSWLTNKQLGASILLGLILFLLSALCIKESNKMDDQWKLTAKNIKKGELDRIGANESASEEPSGNEV